MNFETILPAFLSGGLIAAVVALWNTQRQLRVKRETEASRAEQEALQAYIQEMSTLAPQILQVRSQENKRAQREQLSPWQKLAAILEQRSSHIIRDLLVRASRADNLETELGNEDVDTPRELAQARTRATLLGMGRSVKRVPLTLLYELGLINGEHSVIELKYAALDHADYRALRLPHADLREADLRACDLRGADLSHSFLMKADLRGSDLTRAYLHGADLSGANLLPYDEREPERWSSQYLRHINMSAENLNTSELRLRDGRLVFTKVKVTSLSGADLAKARLRNAVLGGAEMRNADLRGADLSGAYLIGAWHLTQGQIEGAKGDQNTKLPQGLLRPESWTDST